MATLGCYEGGAFVGEGICVRGQDGGQFLHGHPRCSKEMVASFVRQPRRLSNSSPDVDNISTRKHRVQNV